MVGLEVLEALEQSHVLQRRMLRRVQSRECHLATNSHDVNTTTKAAAVPTE